MIKKIKCNKCKKLLPHTYKFFSFHKPGYLRSTCMICDRKRAKNYYHNNKEIYQQNAIKRKKREKKVAGSFIKKDVEKIRINLHDQCAYCNEPLHGKGELDHIISIRRGGTNFLKNMTLACRWCNRNKRTKSANEFLAWRKICGLKNRRGISNGRKI